MVDLPSLNEGSEDHPAIAGFINLANLFRPFDDNFIAVWNKTKTKCSPGWLASIQDQLTEALPANFSCTASQRADLKITQQWLRTLVWQLSNANGCLSSTYPQSSMTFTYPIEIARDLANALGELSKGSMEVHGLRLVGFSIKKNPSPAAKAPLQIEKLFDISCTLIDVMSCVPLICAKADNPQIYLGQFVRLISSLRGGDSSYVTLLAAKIRDTLPMVSPCFHPSSSYNSSVDGIGRLEDESSSGDSSPYGSPSLFTSTPVSENSLAVNILGTALSPRPPTSQGYASYPTSHSQILPLRAMPSTGFGFTERSEETYLLG
ncbi:hypothetical protein MMC09_001437 [Bachmanniomyces sp. S44760]|nr:hypothetical protein [Bachmanniomyces sp. S44760]